MSANATSAPRRRRIPKAGVLIGAAWLIALLFLTIAADWLPFIRGADTKVRVNGRLMSNYKLGPGSVAWWGTDGNGFDVFSRCIYYARNTLFIGLASTVIGLLVGGTLGMLAGYFRGWIDRVISIIVDCLLAIPALVLAIMLVRRLDDIKVDYAWLDWMTRKWQIILTLSILAVAPLARIVRAQTMALREREFVLAARSLGSGNIRILFREILPNLVPAMVTVAATGLGILIGAEGALAFLGLGLEASWGFMINGNRARLEKAWWATIFPCIMLFMTVLSFNLLGDRLARRFDVREAAV
ncbi:MAG: ABC transporter permease [Acidobacteria bacterium]|nr:ABC transporter permease [Acidobacteriota bacterium]